jgi:hypothetical protein
MDNMDTMDDSTYHPSGVSPYVSYVPCVPYQNVLDYAGAAQKSAGDFCFLFRVCILSL